MSRWPTRGSRILLKSRTWRSKLVLGLAAAVAVAGGSGSLIAIAQDGGGSTGAVRSEAARCDPGDAASVPGAKMPASESIASETHPDGSSESTAFYDDGDTYIVLTCDDSGELRTSETVQTFNADGEKVQLVTAKTTVASDGTVSTAYSSYDPGSRRFESALESPAGQQQLDAVPEPTGQDSEGGANP